MDWRELLRILQPEDPMRYRSFYMAMALAILLHLRFGIGQAQEVQVTSDVEALILGPDSKPLADCAMEFTGAERHSSSDQRQAPISVTTDANGVAHFQWKAGVSQIRVHVPGVGYGVCGLTEFVPKVTTKPAFPPLAPYATISGTIPKELIGKVVHVYTRRDKQQKVTLDSTGRFEFTDLEPGTCFLGVRNDQGLELAEGRCELNPGVHQRKVKFTIYSEERAQASTQPIVLRGKNPDKDKTIVWARGTVRDVQGKPLQGADVYAVATYDGGIRMYEDAVKTRSDSNGRYVLSGPGGLHMFTGVVVAHTKGLVPTMAWFDRPSPNDFSGPPPATQPAGDLDLALDDTGGSLDVRVLEDGKPAAGISVLIQGNGAALRDEWARVSHRLRPEIEGFLYPELTTDARGEVHFKHLMPGHYRIIAARPAEINSEMRGARSVELYGRAR